MGSYKDMDFEEIIKYWFPAPIEVWVVSYSVTRLSIDLMMTTGFRPLSRYGWFPTSEVEVFARAFELFPAPLEDWVVSYCCIPRR